MPEWQVDVTGWHRELAPVQTHSALHIHHVHRQEAHTSAPHLPRYQNTSSPDKLECARTRCFLTSQESVTILASCGFFMETKYPEMNPHGVSLSLSLSLSVSLSICFFEYCRMKPNHGAKVNITCCITLAGIVNAGFFTTDSGTIAPDFCLPMTRGRKLANKETLLFFINVLQEP